MKLSWMIFLFPILAQASAEKDLNPSWRSAPFVVFSDVDKSLPPKEQAPLLLARANLVCEFLKAPPGNFRKYWASQIRTKVVRKVEVVSLERKVGRIEPKKFKTRGEQKVEVITSLRCHGE